MTANTTSGRQAEDNGIGRRGFLRGAAGMGMAASPGLALVAGCAAPSTRPAGGDPASDRALLVRGGQVLTMDPAVPDLVQGDVLIRGGRIVQIGTHLSAPDATVIDAADSIVMPGFVDTHSHLWNAFLRGSIRGDDRVRGYFPTTNRAAPLCTPDDAYHSVRFALTEAALSGVTCVNNFSHNTRSVAHAEAEIRAALEVGTRTRFSYGTPGRGARLDRDGVAKVTQRWTSKDPLLTLGVNLQLPAPEVLAKGGEDANFIDEVRYARQLGLPVSLHYGNTAHGLVGLLDRHDLLGPQILLIHTQGYTARERERMVARNVPFSMSPAIEIPYSTVRNGYIQFAELEQLGASLSLSTDASSAMATYNFFTVMRALQWAHKQRGDVDRTLEPKRIVELATIDGAKALHLDREIGSLTPGKRADVILVRKTDINMVPVVDPYYSLVYSGEPGNVRTVIVGGKVQVADGRPASLDVAEVAGAAGRAGRAMHARLEALIQGGKENMGAMNRKG